MSVSIGYRSFFLVVLFAILLIGLNACSFVSTQSASSPSATPSPAVELTLEEVPVEEALPFFQDQISQQILSSIEALNSGGILSIHTLAKFGPSDGEMTQGPSVLIRPDDSLSGYLLLNTSLGMPHTFGLFATLDYLPIPIEFNQTAQAMPSVYLPEGQKAFRFTLPPLPEGVHTLVVKYISEPYLPFEAVTADTLSMEVWDGLHWREAPFEFGILIWSTEKTPQTALDWPEITHPIPPMETEFITSIFLQKHRPSSGESMIRFSADTLSPGDMVTYQMLVEGSGLGKGEVPLRVIVVWDERLTQVLDFSIPAKTTHREEFIPLTIRIPEDASPGDHYLTIIGFPYPYYLRGYLNDPGWDANVGFYSHLIARLVIRIPE